MSVTHCVIDARHCNTMTHASVNNAKSNPKKMELTFLVEIKKHKIRALKTFVTCLCYICIGYQGSIVGVSLIDLKVLAQSTLSQITLILTGNSVGYAAGSVVAGFLEARFNSQLVMSICLAITAMCQFAFPLTPHLIALICLGVCSGFFSGITDCCKF